MITLRATGHLLRLVTGTTSTIDVVVSAIECDNATPPVIQDIVQTVVTQITTAGTNTIIDCTTANRRRNVKGITVHNTDAAIATQARVEFYDGTNAKRIIDVNLLAGETLVFTENGIWMHLDSDACLKPANAKIDAKLVVSSDVTNATTSFADVTGLTQALKSGKKYAFEAQLIHQTNATTTGAQFGYNIGATPTAVIVWGSGQITASVTAATFGASAAITAVDTATVVETTGPGANNFCHYMTGFIKPSADGTFAIRCKSEVAVAGGLIVKAGSWLRIWELDN